MARACGAAARAGRLAGRRRGHTLAQCPHAPRLRRKAAAVTVLTNYCFLWKCSLQSLDNAMLEPIVSEHWLRRHRIGDEVSDDDSKESRACLIRIWKRSILLFLVISALFWEIRVVKLSPMPSRMCYRLC